MSKPTFDSTQTAVLTAAANHRQNECKDDYCRSQKAVSIHPPILIKMIRQAEIFEFLGQSWASEMEESLQVLTMYNEEASINDHAESRRLKEFIGTSIEIPGIEIKEIGPLQDYLLNHEWCVKFVKEKTMSFYPYFTTSDADVMQGRIVPSYVTLKAPHVP